MFQPTETVTRPDPGLARGKWEAPAWAFWVALAVVVVGTALYVMKRMGMLRYGSTAKTRDGNASPPPSASRGGRGPRA